MVETVIVPDSAAADQWLLETVLGLARGVVATRGNFTMALSGGTSPLPFYRALAATDFPWKQTQVWLVDERFVPAGHPDHNGSAIRSILCMEAGGVLPESNLHLIDTSYADSILAASAYAADLAAVPAKQGWPQFDFILLGMGTDGHTASLFPGTGAVKVHDRRALAVIPLTAAHQRISLTLPVLNAARNVVFLVTGAAKRDMLAKVRLGKNPELPASLVDAPEGRVVFLADGLSAPD